MTVSLGVSELMGDSTREEWIKRADEALYSAKKTGRNKTVMGAPPAQKEALAATGSSAENAAA